jgi:serine/threonine-protein kinase
MDGVPAVSGLADSSPPGDFYCPGCEKKFAAGDHCPTDGMRLVRLSAAIDPFIGRELDGRYTILEKLGQGGMGTVYRGSQHSVGRDCAIKVINPSQVTDEDAIKRFLREAKLASRLSHPNAVAVHDFGQTSDGVFYLAMELVEGRTLDQVLKDEKVFEPHRVAWIGSQVCDALESAHALQIVHRDLKPSNIMRLSRGRDLVKVLDFGLAKSLAPDQTSTTMTGTGDLLGTPAFMPPELALGQPCDGRADLYSLGCVLYQLGSGRLPFRSTSRHEMVAMHTTLRAPRMTGVPRALAQVIERMLEKDPAARYQSASACREALEAAVEGRLFTPVPGASTRNDTPLTAAPSPKTSDEVPGEATPHSHKVTSRPVVPAEPPQHVSTSTIADSDTVPRLPPRRRSVWVIPAIAIGALAVGGGVFALFVREPHETPARVRNPPPAAVAAQPVPTTPTASVAEPRPVSVVTSPSMMTPRSEPSPPEVKPVVKSHTPKPARANAKLRKRPLTTTGPQADDDKDPF